LMLPLLLAVVRVLDQTQLTMAVAVVVVVV
jgi:hypothetical protein